MEFIEPYLIYIVLVLTILLPLFPPPPWSVLKIHISTKERIEIVKKHRLFFLVFLLIILISGFNIHYENNKSIESDSTQKSTKTNTDKILTNVDKTTNELSLLSNRLNKLNPRLDSLEKRTIKSISKIDNTLNLLDKYDSLQELKFIESGPKLAIDCVLYIYSKPFEFYLIQVTFMNDGGRPASDVKLDAHFFYIDSTTRHIIGDRDLSDELFNRIEIPPSLGHITKICEIPSHSKSLAMGVIQLGVSYQDELLKRKHQIVERYIYDGVKLCKNTFLQLSKEQGRYLDKYIEDKKIKFN